MSDEIRVPRPIVENLQRLAAPDGPRVKVSVPGALLLAGYPTDSQGGRVIAAAVEEVVDGSAGSGGLTLVGQAHERRRVLLHGEKNESLRVDLRDLRPRRHERGRVAALVRGVVAARHEAGAEIGGFEALISRRIEPRDELASPSDGPTTFTVGIAALLESLYGRLEDPGVLDPFVLSETVRRAMARYTGALAGPAASLACVLGGMIELDFAEPTKPRIRRVDLDPHAHGWRLLQVTTRGDVGKVRKDLGAIEEELSAVARLLGRPLAGVEWAELTAASPRVRRSVGDRALARALFCVREIERVRRQADALDQGDFAAFLDGVRASGAAARTWLQNVWPDPRHVDPRDHELALALALTDDFLARPEVEGAARPHGDGFVEGVQVWLRDDAVDAYREALEPVLGPGAIRELRIRGGGLSIDS